MPVMDVILGDISYTLGVGPGNTFLRVAGNLSGSNTPKLSAAFQRGAKHIQGKLFLSLQGCYAIDSQGLAFLVQQGKNLGDRVKVCSGDGQSELRQRSPLFAAGIDRREHLAPAELRVGVTPCPGD